VSGAGSVAIVGGGVVGAAAALELARRGAGVVLLEAEPELGLAASGTNSGILHSGFDSTPGELETDLILRSVARRDELLDALGIPVLRCGAELQAGNEAERATVRALAQTAARNGVEARVRDDGALEVPGEWVTDPVAWTLALGAAAEAAGADVRVGTPVQGIRRAGEGLELDTPAGAVRCRVALNCAGLRADEVARMAGDDGFGIFARKGEFLVFAPPPDAPLERILLPVPTERTKGVLVFPSIDGHVIAGPTAHDQDDKDDWSVRAEGVAEVRAKVAGRLPWLAAAEPVGAYAGLRPAGRGVNYLVGPSPACPPLIHAAAIRSTGLSASLGIAERLAGHVEAAGVPLGTPAPLRRGRPPVAMAPWWRRTAEHRAT
jgi:glycerol-3-phosphate dehydrogenase